MFFSQAEREGLYGHQDSGSQAVALLAGRCRGHARRVDECCRPQRAAADASLQQQDRHAGGAGTAERQPVVDVDEPRIARRADQSVCLAIGLFHAGRSGQGPGRRARRARPGGRGRDAGGLEHRQGPDEGGRLRTRARHRQQQFACRRQSDRRHPRRPDRAWRRRGPRRRQPFQENRRCRVDVDRRPFDRAGRAGARSFRQNRHRLGGWRWRRILGRLCGGWCQRLRQYRDRSGDRDGLSGRLHQDGCRLAEKRAQCAGGQRAAGGAADRGHQAVLGCEPAFVDRAQPQARHDAVSDRRKVGIWWKVSDELGNIGWVVSSKLELAH